MISRFSCKNYKNINVDSLELKRVNLLVGPNNSGKSNFISAINYLADMLRVGKENGFRSSFINYIKENNWSHIMNKGLGKLSPIEFAWFMHAGDRDVEYKIQFVAGDKVEDCDILWEEINITGSDSDKESKENCGFRFHEKTVGKGVFFATDEKDSKQEWMVNASSKDSVLARYEEILLNSTGLLTNNHTKIKLPALFESVKKHLMTYRHYKSSGFDLSGIREPYSTQSIDDYLHTNAVNFAGVFNLYKAKDIIWRDSFNERMRELIHDLKTEDVVSEYNKLFFKMVYDGGQFDLSDVSEGTLKGLVLNLLLHAPQGVRTGLLALDEPEMNLHPAWQKVVGNWILHANGVDQCIISTHSPDLLDVFTESFLQGDVAVFVFDNYGSHIRKLDGDSMKDELDGWTLGDLYRTSDPAIGGWPW
ncbi:MAG: ATP-binding protein [Lachnospiraceae bacterium]|nr:ATP-binding protein [Lachnospiraceae bacterium]